MNADSITLLPATALALSELGLGTFQTVETPERMAWVVLVLCELPDEPQFFPHGKWGLIQHIEDQLDDAARAATGALGHGVVDRVVRRPVRPEPGAPGAPAGPPEGDPTPVQAPWTPRASREPERIPGERDVPPVHARRWGCRHE